MALLSLTEQITLGASINLLGGSGEQSQRVHAYITGDDPNSIDQFWGSYLAPRWMLVTDPSKKESRLNNGGMMKCLMASGTSVRGPHPQRLRLDEIDEMRIDIFDSALGQTMASRGVQAQTVCSSTHHHPDKTMTEVLIRAKENGWPVYEWCMRVNMYPHGWLDPAEVERKKKEVPKAMWETEYELQEPAPEARAIDIEAVNNTFRRELGEESGAEGKPILIETPGAGRQFYHGTDWAKSQDWTIIHSMMKVEDGPDRLAAWLRMGRRPWPQMIAEHNKRVKEYGGGSYHDATGVGGVCNDYLEVKSAPFDFSRRKRRDDMISSYVAAIENGDLEYPYIAWAYNEHKFATNDMLYGSDHLPDSIAAGALAWRARNLLRRAQPYGGRR